MNPSCITTQPASHTPSARPRRLRLFRQTNVIKRVLSPHHPRFNIFDFTWYEPRSSQKASPQFASDGNLGQCYSYVHRSRRIFISITGSTLAELSTTIEGTLTEAIIHQIQRKGERFTVSRYLATNNLWHLISGALCLFRAICSSTKHFNQYRLQFIKLPNAKSKYKQSFPLVSSWFVYPIVR